MQTIQFIPCTEGANGTSLRGSIEASVADLKEMFGEPWFEGFGDKVTTEWTIDFRLVMVKVIESMVYLLSMIGIEVETFMTTMQRLSGT